MIYGRNLIDPPPPLSISKENIALLIVGGGGSLLVISPLLVLKFSRPMPPLFLALMEGLGALLGLSLSLTKQ